MLFLSIVESIMLSLVLGLVLFHKFQEPTAIEQLGWSFLLKERAWALTGEKNTNFLTDKKLY